MKKLLSDEDYKHKIIHEGLRFFPNKINSDKEAYQLFIHCKELLLQKYAEEEKLYGDIFKEYDKFLLELVELLKNINLSNPLEYSLALRYLIWNGYLSKDLKYNRIESENELSKKYGINIILGEGCCRNFSDMHYDVMKRLNEYVRQYFCATRVLLKPLKATRANHILNIIEYDGLRYGIDLYNQAELFKFTDGFNLKDTNFYSNAKLRNKPYLNLIYTDETIDDIVNDVKMYEEDSKKIHLSPFIYYLDLIPAITERLNNQKDIFMDFHNETKIIKENICEGMQRKLTQSNSSVN